MERRHALELLGFSAGALAFSRLSLLADDAPQPDDQEKQELLKALDRLKAESPARAEVRVERGGPRLFVNGKEVYPLLALSAEVLKTAASYRDGGIGMLAPILGLNACWKAPGKYDFEFLDIFFARLLAISPGMFFLPRLHLNAPRWWKDAHPDELAKHALPCDPAQYKLDERIGESGLNWNGLLDAYDASYASTLWRREMGEVLVAFLRHMEASPLVSRILGYQVTAGMTGEWHYPGSRYLPDYSAPMEAAIGAAPSPEARLTTTYGLLRDPEKESDTIDYYQRFHTYEADTILYFARIVKRETRRRILCGTFYTYLLENVCIQEAGHLAPERILFSRDIDFIPSPYSYQHTNIPGKERWESDIVDDAGNWLGRARGVGGDGGYRVLLESLRRHGKLFIVEIDPTTYLEPKKSGEGGSGHETVEGTTRILQRDLGQMFTAGVGGWLFDFGHYCPPFKANRGWYDDAPIVKTIKTFTELGKRRPQLDISPAALMAAVYDARSFFATQHWKAEEPWTGYGISITDFFNHWFLNSQARTFHRIGAPMDFLYRFDLVKEDPRRYRLLFMVNLFSMTAEDVTSMRELLRDSGTTVVWYYAPGFITPDKFDRAQMERLTGFKFRILEEAGPMYIRTVLPPTTGALLPDFGVKKKYFPRFTVLDRDATILGRWGERDDVAFASKETDGWTSVYVGAAPISAEVLRYLAGKAGVPLWSTQPDVVRATRDAAMIVASSPGERTLTLPTPMSPAEGGKRATTHRLTMDFGEVKIFTT